MAALSFSSFSEMGDLPFSFSGEGFDFEEPKNCSLAP